MLPLKVRILRTALTVAGSVARMARATGTIAGRGGRRDRPCRRT